MKKYTTYTYEITYEELVDAVKAVILRNDPSANINLGTINSQKWLEVDSNKSPSIDRKEIASTSTILLSIEMEK
ncbi:hypothetical protein CMI41_01085 [Candidatus Pacearchaeota archaeon]|nr:hypothetical protein [Candidatus Pacearchaeota archaeon]|tara:strand:- start:5323 stop:5544 length:222 start_codon:yes stop_codon:yes gene_type:complete